METRWQRNPDALKFNVCKKLAQLNRVILLFKGQEADRIWKCKCLYDIYDPKIRKALLEYTDEMKKLNEQVAGVDQEILGEVESCYKEKNQRQKEDFEKFSKNLAEENRKKLDDVIVEITNSKCVIESLKQGMEKRRETFEKEIEEFKKKEKEQIDNVKLKTKQEIEVVDKETKARMEQLKAEFDKKRKQMKADCEKELERIRREAADKNDVGSQLLAFVQTMKGKVKDLRHSVGQLRNGIEQKKDERSSWMKTKREHVESFCKKWRDEIDGNEKEKRDLEKEMKQLRHDWHEEEGKLKQEFKNAKAENEKVLEQMNAERMKMLDEMKSELERIRKELDAGQQQNGLSLNELKEKQEREIQELEKKLSSAKASSEKKLEEIRKKVDARRVACQEKEEQERQKNKERCQGLDKAESDLSGDLKRILEETKLRFKQELDDLNGKMMEMTGSSQKDQEKRAAEFSQLKREKEDVIDKHRAALEKLENVIQKDTQALSEKHAKELEDLRRKSQANIEQFQKEMEKRVEERKRQNQEKKNELTKVLAQQHEKTISDISNAGYSKDEYQTLEKTLTTEYETLTKKLEGITAPACAGKDYFQAMNQEIETLEKQKEALRQTIDNDRQSLVDGFNRKIDGENARHEEATKPTHSGRGRKQVLQSITQQIETVRSQLADEAKALEDVQKQQREAHELKMSEFDTTRKGLLDQAEIELLKAELAKVQEKFAATKDLDAQRESDIAKQQARLKETEAEYQQRIDELEAQLRALKDEFESQRTQLMSDQESNTDTFSRTYDKESKSTQATIARLKKDHDDSKKENAKHQTAIRQIMATEESEFQKELQREFARGENRVTEIEKSLKEDARKRDEEWKGMLGYYNERISVLTAKLAEAQHLFDNCPPRQCDLDQIARLENTLQLVKTQLGNALTDLKQYRSMLVEQERTYNRAFGVSPKVGIMQSPRECL